MSGWHHVPTPPDIAALNRAMGATATDIYQKDLDDGHLTAIVAKEPYGLHLSISHRTTLVSPSTGKPMPGRYPTWDEISDARYQLLPDKVYMAQILPPRKEYVNVHPTTFHLFEIPKDIGQGYR